jgi:hypothetical protein
VDVHSSPGAGPIRRGFLAALCVFAAVATHNAPARAQTTQTHTISGEVT